MIKQFLKNNKELHYIFSKGGITFLFRMVAMVFSFLTMWFITNQYGEAVFGRYTLALTILQLTALFFAFGLPPAFVSFAGEFISENQHKGLLIKMVKLLLISSLVPLLLYSLFPEYLAITILNKNELKPYILITSIAVVLLMLHELVCYYFVSTKKFKTYGLLIFIFPNIFFIMFLVLFKCFNFESYFTFVAYVLSIALTLIIGFTLIIFNKIGSKKYFNSSKSMLKESIPMMMGGLFLVLLNWTDILMLARFKNTVEIGIYNVAFKVGYLALFFVVSMNVIIMPKVSEFYHQKNIDEMKKVVNKGTQTIIILTLPLVLVIIFFSEFILSFFGEGFVAGSSALILITLGALFNAMTGNVDQILNMTGNQKNVRNVFLIGFLVNVILNYILIPIKGILGAAIASLLTNILINTILVVIIKRKLGFYTFM